VGDPLKGGKTGKCLLSTDSLLMDHTTNSTPHHSSWRFEVERSPSRIRVHPFGTELCIFHAISDHWTQLMFHNTHSHPPPPKAKKNQIEMQHGIGVSNITSGTKL
jgi:hypothetical protein